MDVKAELARERRARMAAERLLDLRQRELAEANAQLGRHANALSEQIVEKREEAENLRGKAARALEDLRHANEEVDIAKQRLWDSIETFQDGFAVFDPDSRLIVANNAYLAALDHIELVRAGLKYADLISLMLEEGIVDIGTQEPRAWRQKMMDRWAQPQPPNMVIKLWNGQSIKLHDRRSATGDTTTLALNITDSIRNAERLERAGLRAEAANRAKSAFLARMSHELRTPMNGVVGMADLLAETKLDPDQALYTETIKSSAEALLVLINDVLDFSKLEASRLTLVEEKFSLEHLLAEIGRSFQPALKDVPIELVIDCDANMPSHFMGDAGRVRQIMNNLIGNAIKFTEAGQVTVRALTVALDGERTELRLTVSDTGIGINDDQKTHIFGEFNQVEDATNRKYEGTGLGLAITRQLVELMGGNIWVESQPGAGSTFGVKLVLRAKHKVKHNKCLPEGVARLAVAAENGAAMEVIAAQLGGLGARVERWQPGQPVLAQALIYDADQPIMGQMMQVRADAVGAVPVFAFSFLRHEAPEEVTHLPKPAMLADFLKAADDLAPWPAVDRTATGPRPMRVLAAEDNQTNRLVFEKLVKALAIDLHFATDGREAVAQWEALHPDLVFMDISMPGMDGKEATQIIRQREHAASLKRTPIVALTAHAVSGDREEILAAGLDHYLTKPLKKDLIFEQIRKACPEDCLPLEPDGAAELDTVRPKEVGQVKAVRDVWDSMPRAEESAANA